MQTVLVTSALLLVLLTFATTGAHARVMVASFSAQGSLTFVGEPTSQWTDEEGILHIRGQSFAFEVYGADLRGSLHLVANLDVDPATGDGAGWGSHSYVGIWEKDGTFDNPVAWDGLAVLRLDGSGGLISGEFFALGRTGFAGTVVRGTFAETGPVGSAVLFQGTVFSTLTPVLA